MTGVQEDEWESRGDEARTCWETNEYRMLLLMREGPSLLYITSAAYMVRDRVILQTVVTLDVGVVACGSIKSWIE